MWGRFLETTAKCVSSERDFAIPAAYAGKAWAARLYYMTTWAGPREGECSDHPVSFGWLYQMVEEGQLPRDLKVSCVEGGTAWVRLGSEINKVHQAERNAAKVSSSTSSVEAGAMA